MRGCPGSTTTPRLRIQSPHNDWRVHTFNPKFSAPVGGQVTKEVRRSFAAGSVHFEVVVFGFRGSVCRVGPQFCPICVWSVRELAIGSFNVLGERLGPFRFQNRVLSLVAL